MARYSNDMVAHVWAQANRDAGESNNGNFYFVGPRLYSYGSHFIVGYIDGQGRAWINADGYSISTAKHKSYAWRAVSHRKSYNVPSLTKLVPSLEGLNEPSRAAVVKRDIRAYMDSHWEAFPAGSEAAAILWAAVSPRGSWAKERARRDAKAARDAATNAKRLKAQGIAIAKQVAAIPLDMVRLRMIQVAMNTSDWSRDRDMKRAVAYYVDAHRGSAPGKVRAACWERVKLARELSARLMRHGKHRNAATRGAIAHLRRLWAGDHDAPATAMGRRHIAQMERDNLRTLAGAHMSPALRARLIARQETVESAIRVATAEIEAEHLAAQAEKRAGWLAGAVAYGRDLVDGNGGALIRASGVEMEGCRVISGDLETSQGAVVPLRHAVRAFALVRAIREKAQGEGLADCARVWTAGESDIRVGHFRVDSIFANGDFIAGCHRINWGETERLARSLGLWDCPATALSDETAQADA